ncbi:hypothetical protein Tco_0473083 [Tanacetum coccineum]
MMGVFAYFLGFQIKQSERGISVYQENYVKDLLKKHDINGSSMKTLMVPPSNLGPDLNGKAVNETQYRGIIGSLMYLTASRLDIQFSTCFCARYQANSKESHLIIVKRIFKYLKVTPSLGLWYPKCLDFDLKGYLDSDNAGCNMDKKALQVPPLDEPTFKRLIIELVNRQLFTVLEYLVKFWYTATSNLKTRKVFFSIPTGSTKGDVGLNSFRNALGANSLSYSRDYVEPPTQAVVKQFFLEIRYCGTIEATGTLKKSCLSPRWQLLMANIIKCLGGKIGGEKVIPYTRFLSLLLEHKMQETYKNNEATPILTLIFSVYNWALKKDQPEGPPFKAYMLYICKGNGPVSFKAPKATSQTKKVEPEGKKPRAKTRRKKSVPILMNNLMGTGEEGANPQLSSVESASDQEPVFLAFTIVHSESVSGHDALADFIAEADPGKSDPKDFLSQQQDGLRTVQPEPKTKKGSTDELFGMDSDKDNQSSVGNDDELKCQTEDLTFADQR